MVNSIAFGELSVSSHPVLQLDGQQADRWVHVGTHSCSFLLTLSHSLLSPSPGWTPFSVVIFQNVSSSNFFFLRDLFGFCLTVVSMYFLFIYSVIRFVPPTYLGHSHPTAISPPHVFDNLWLRYSHANIIISSVTYSFNKLSSNCVFAGVGTVLKGFHSSPHREKKLLVGRLFVIVF